MKKFLPIIAIIIIAAAAAYLSFSGGEPTPISSAPTGPGTTSANNTSSAPEPGQVSAPQPIKVGDEGLAGETDVKTEADRRAEEVYKSAEEAFKAVKDGAADYNDIILEQFTQPSENCTWCDAFYEQVKAMLTAVDTTPDQKSYYAEILAISGRLENIKTLVEGIKGAPSPEQADMYAEALELTIGKSNIASFLGEQLNSENSTLKEASVAALTNQGSRQAVDLLFDNAVKNGDPDGFYSLGIGLGELVPDSEALPRLQEIAQQRNAYSHLAVKSLLNGGVEGLRIVFDILASSKDPEFDRQMLKGAVDHVSYEEEAEKLAEKAAQSGSPMVAEFAKQVIEDFKSTESQASVPEEAEEEAPMTPLNPNQ
jgi:hypothetical protein